MDIGFGMGYNTFLSVEVAEKIALHSLHVSALDQDKMLLQHSASAVSNSLHVKILEALYKDGVYEAKNSTISFYNVEARYMLSKLENSFDIIFVDPFLETNNASLVSVEFFRKLKKLLKKEGVLVCSTALTSVQIALVEVGFEVKVVNDEMSDIKGLYATHAIVNKKMKGFAYRDPYSIWSDKEIAMHREKEMHHGG